LATVVACCAYRDTMSRNVLPHDAAADDHMAGGMDAAEEPDRWQDARPGWP